MKIDRKIKIEKSRQNKTKQKQPPKTSQINTTQPNKNLSKKYYRSVGPTSSMSFISYDSASWKTDRTDFGSEMPLDSMTMWS